MQAFIPKPYPKEAVTVRVESEYLQVIDKIISHDSRFSRSLLINQCVKFAIDNIDLRELKIECEPVEQMEADEREELPQDEKVGETVAAE